MEKEEFDPTKFKSVDELPPEKQSQFESVNDGFIRQEALENLSHAELAAEIAYILNNENITAIDILHQEAQEMNLEKQKELFLGRMRELKEKLFFNYVDLSEEEVEQKVKELHVADREFQLLYDALPSDLKNDIEFISEAVKINPLFYYTIPDGLQGDKKIASEALKNSAEGVRYRRGGWSAGAEAVQFDDISPEAADSIVNDDKLFKEIIKTRKNFFIGKITDFYPNYYMTDKLKEKIKNIFTDKEMVIELLKKNDPYKIAEFYKNFIAGGLLEFDHEIIIQAIKISPCVIRVLPNSIKRELRIALNSKIGLHPIFSEYVSEAIK